MIPIIGIMLVTSSMTTGYHHLPACMQLKQCKEAYTYQVEHRKEKQYILLTDYKGSEEKLQFQIRSMELKLNHSRWIWQKVKIKSITLSKNIASERYKESRTKSDYNTGRNSDSKDNAAYQSEDGILYTKDKKNWLLIKIKKSKETYVMPSRSGKSRS